MTELPWWEQWPERLKYEQDALDAAGIRWRLDEFARVRGVLRLVLTVPIDAGQTEMTVVFPDHYPFFRFQVYAPGLQLGHHQDPFHHTLCLLERRTHAWNATDTVADLLKRQLPNVIAAGRETDTSRVAGVEQRQAEPFSDYYRYCTALFLIQSDWVIPPNHRSGRLIIGTAIPGDRRPPMEFRGAVLEVHGTDGSLICSADPALRDAFGGRTVIAHWARVPSPIRQSHPQVFLHELSKLHPALGYPPPIHLQDDRWLCIWAVLFPEEIDHRTMGEGWVFVGSCEHKRPPVPGPRPPHFSSANTKQRKKNRRNR